MNGSLHAGNRINPVSRCGHLFKVHTSGTQALHIGQPFLPGKDYVSPGNFMGIRIGINSPAYTFFPQNLKHRIRGTVGIVGGIVYTATRKLIGRVKSSYLVDAFVPFFPDDGINGTNQFQKSRKPVEIF
jgi:hypothetical protein